MNHPTINQQEAGAFATHCALRGISSADALAELARTTWPDSREDAAFGRHRHTPTIRRLAKPLLLALDAQHAAAALRREHETADRARWAELSAAQQAEIVCGLFAAGDKTANRRVRDLARGHGIVLYTETIDLLAELVTGRGFGHIRSARFLAELQ